MAMAAAADALAAKRKIPVWLKVFFWWHVYAIAAWSLPTPPQAIRLGTERPSLGSIASNPIAWALAANQAIKTSPYSPLRWYMMGTGLWQYWDMFAPNPMSNDMWVDAEILWDDGATSIQPYPRMAKLNLVDKYLQERFRKYVDRFNSSGDQAKLAALGQRLAFLAAREPGRLPTQVTIRLHSRRIQRMGIPTPDGYQERRLAVVEVDKDKLKRDKGWR